MWCFKRRARRHNAVHFFDISISETGLRMVSFARLGLDFFQMWSNVDDFLSLIWPDGSAPAALGSVLLTLWGQEPLEKRNVSRPCYLFAHLRLLYSAFLFCLSSLPLPIPVSHVSILSEI